MDAPVLLTGATGYIGGRLLRRFEEGGRAVRCLVRRPGQLNATAASTEIVQGDCLDEPSLDRALAGVECAYYLVHSMGRTPDFADADRRAAETFARSARRAGVRRIVYLGGLADDATPLSAHLKSRAETGEILRASGVPVIEFRASVVIGAGSLSFEMIQALVERLPVMFCPRWVSTLTQPIAIDDVLAFLEAALELPEAVHGIFEIGGPEVVSYGDLMRRFAGLRGLRRLLVPVPVLSPHLSGLWLALVTPAQARVGRALVEGLKNSTVVRSTAARDTFGIEPMSLSIAIAKAIGAGNASRLKTDTRSVVVDVPPADAFAPIRRIGGETGWYFGDMLWRARGWVDRRLGGVGMNRGRRDRDVCDVGDPIDGWTVEAFEPDRRLRLSADFKLPGKGWLDFEVTPLDGGRRSMIRQTATFDPRGVMGRAYWYAILPIHNLIFGGLLERIAERAGAADGTSERAVFTFRSVVPGRAADLFRWHERPQAVMDLLPSRRFVRIERQTGGLRDGGVLTIALGVRPLSLRWEARHYGYVRDRQFCDEQVRGPFKLWRHTHRIEPIGTGQSLYEDRVEYAVPGGRLTQRLAVRVLHPLLARAFARRHRIVHAAMSGVSQTLRLTALWLALACAVAFAPPAAAQDTTGVGSLSGIVEDATAAPAAFVTLCLAGTAQCAVTDERGAFLLEHIRSGEYALEATPPGGTPLGLGRIAVRAGVDQRVEVTLPATSRLETTITVTAPNVVLPDEVKTSAYLVTAEEVFRSAGSLQDVSRFVQTLPGVVPGSDDFRNDIIVRGGSPLENLFVVDNVEVPNINTFASFASAGGTVSMLEPSMIRDVTFLTGGYPASYSNRTSSVLQITQREGSREKVQARATLGFAGAGGSVEGPLSKGRGSWVVAARRSFLDVFTADAGIGGVPVLYTLNAKAVYDLNPTDRIWVVNVSGADRIRLGLTDSTPNDQEVFNFDIRYRGWRSATGVNWQHLYGTRGVGLLGVTNSTAAVGSTVKDLVRNGLPAPGISADQIIASSPEIYDDDSRESETTVKYDATLTRSSRTKVQLGASVKQFRVRYNSAAPLGYDSPYSREPGMNAFRVSERLTAWQPGAYGQFTHDLTPALAVTAGGRFDRYQYIDASRFSPRVAATLALTARLSLQASAGIYYQQPAFQFLVVFPENRALKPFRAHHYVGGIAYVVPDGWSLGVEAYRKDYRDYPVAAEYPSVSLANLGDTFNVQEVLFPLTSGGTGRSLGIEVQLARKGGGPWYGQLVLSLSQARHAGRDGVLRPGSFDYPLVLNLTGGRRWSRKWESSVRVASRSGRPYTPFDVPESTRQRRGVYDLSNVNAVRGPVYVRIDARIDRNATIAGKPAILFAGVQNLTGRRNVSGYTWNRRTNAPDASEQLGVFPLVGLEWRF